MKFLIFVLALTMAGTARAEEIVPSPDEPGQFISCAEIQGGFQVKLGGLGGETGILNLNKQGLTRLRNLLSAWGHGNFSVANYENELCIVGPSLIEITKSNYNQTTHVYTYVRGASTVTVDNYATESSSSSTVRQATTIIFLAKNGHGGMDPQSFVMVSVDPLMLVEAARVLNKFL